MPPTSLATTAARALHTGPGAGLGLAPPLVAPLVQSTVQQFGSLDDVDAVQDGRAGGFVYYRMGHPNAAALEATVAALEGAEACVATASGMAAIAAAVLATCEAGDHVVVDAHAYGGTRTLLGVDLPRLGVTATPVDATDLDALAAAIGPRTRLVVVEALSNPTLRVVDLAAVAGVAHRHGAAVLVDATFVSPALLRPVEHGADLVTHSIPKYLGGHSVAMGGVLSGRAGLVAAARTSVVHLGASIGPFDAWMALAGIATLPLRMAAHSRNAVAVATHLAAHPAIGRVDHPSLPHHPQHDLAGRLFPDGWGGMVTFELPGGRPAVEALVRALAGRIPFAPSLADVATTLSHPATTSHRALGAEARAALGITDGLVRLSVGIEDPADVVAELDAGLAVLR